MDLTERLDAMESAIKKPSFRQSSGKANEVNYWIFDYPPEKELEVRERIAYMKHKNTKGTDGFELVVFDLYDIIIDFLEGKGFIEKCYEFEKKRGIQRIVKAGIFVQLRIDADQIISFFLKPGKWVSHSITLLPKICAEIQRKLLFLLPLYLKFTIFPKKIQS